MSIYANNVKDTAETQENLNPQQGVFPILIRSEETLLIEEGPTIVYSNNVSDMAIWDNPSSTWDGPDTNDEWDSYSDDKEVFHVTNPDNLFIERFAFTTLQGSLNTCAWDTTNKEATFTSGQICHVDPAYKDGNNVRLVTSVTLNLTVVSGSYTYEASANGGTNWETITVGTQHLFTNTGSELQIRITENNTSTGTIKNIRALYTVG